MPTISSFPFEAKAISLSVERDSKRSAGVHLSAIIRDRLITAGIERKVKGSTDFTDDERHLLWQTGFLWERLVSEYIQSNENRCLEWEWFIKPHLKVLTDDAVAKSNGDIVRPGECSLDGIAMTPDAINIKGSFVEEWKATGIRSTNLTDKNLFDRKPEWGWQTAAYAKVFGYTKGIIRVFHYAQLPPVVSQWLVEWTQQEIDNNWRNLMIHWQYMQTRNSVVDKSK